MKRAGNTCDGKPPKKARNECAAIVAENMDYEGWLKLVGLEAFMDLKKREQRTGTALCRDAVDLQPFTLGVIRMLGFPTSRERLLVWLRSKGRLYKQLKVGELAQIKQLNLRFNKLTSVPKEIGDLKQLVWLNLNNNKLTSVPKEIGNLKQLCFLHLNKNQLTSMPNEIGDLKQLQELDLYENKLTSVPKEIGDLKQLKELNLNNNKLTSVPKDIGNLKQLKKLNLNNNKLTSVPKEIGNLEQLEDLRLNDNQLTVSSKRAIRDAAQCRQSTGQGKHCSRDLP
jgi:Leucine-rich repeat (LRR) protein